MHGVISVCECFRLTLISASVCVKSQKSVSSTEKRKHQITFLAAEVRHLVHDFAYYRDCRKVGMI